MNDNAVRSEADDCDFCNSKGALGEQCKCGTKTKPRFNMNDRASICDKCVEPCKATHPRNECTLFTDKASEREKLISIFGMLQLTTDEFKPSDQPCIPNWNYELLADILLGREHIKQEQHEILTKTILDTKNAEVKEWKDKYKTLNHELMCELRDPCGTIWEHAKKLQDENDKLKADRIKMLSEIEKPLKFECDNIDKAIGRMDLDPIWGMQRYRLGMNEAIATINKHKGE